MRCAVLRDRIGDHSPGPVCIAPEAHRMSLGPQRRSRLVAYDSSDLTFTDGPAGNGHRRIPDPCRAAGQLHVFPHAPCGGRSSVWSPGPASQETRGGWHDPILATGSALTDDHCGRPGVSVLGAVPCAARGAGARRVCDLSTRDEYQQLVQQISWGESTAVTASFSGNTDPPKPTWQVPAWRTD